MPNYIVRVITRHDDVFVKVTAASRAAAHKKVSNNPRGFIAAESYAESEFYKYKWMYGNLRVNLVAANVEKYMPYENLSVAKKKQFATHCKKYLISYSKFLEI